MVKLWTMRSMTGEQVTEYAKYFVVNHSTIRDTAKHFGVKNTTLYDAFTKHLESWDKPLYDEVSRILLENRLEYPYISIMRNLHKEYQPLLVVE